MKTELEYIEALNQKVTVNLKLIAQAWNEDFESIKEFFYFIVDRYNLPYDNVIIDLYNETELAIKNL